MTRHTRPLRGSGNSASSDYPESLSDAEWLKRFAAGNPHAARELTQRLAPRCHALALRILDNPADAEDITQEAMLRLWRVAASWRNDGAAPATWLYKVALNLCIDRQRKSSRLTIGLATAPESASDEPAAEDRMLEETRRTALQAALMALPERQRQAVVLRHIEELPNPEIAIILNISVDAVESLIARGKRALATSLASRRSELGYEQ